MHKVQEIMFFFRFLKKTWNEFLFYIFLYQLKHLLLLMFKLRYLWVLLNEFINTNITWFQHISGSIVVSMGACHALDPGSIPGRRVFLTIFYNYLLIYFIIIFIIHNFLCFFSFYKNLNLDSRINFLPLLSLII